MITHRNILALSYAHIGKFPGTQVLQEPIGIRSTYFHLPLYSNIPHSHTMH